MYPYLKDSSKYFDAKILLVDDEIGNLKILKRMLNKVGYLNILTAHGGQEGVDIYTDEQPDLMVLDLKMPGLNGFEVMTCLKNKSLVDSYHPIIALTAQQDEETRLAALEGGAKDFIGKPFELTEILARINNMLEVRLLHNQIREQNKSLEERVRERAQELEKTRQEVLNRLGRASEYRDNETGMHVIRMGLYAEILARAIGLADRECDLILQASPLHDVGKIGIPDHILLKPGKLDEPEWEIMKTHCKIGAEILSGSHSDLLKAAEIIALNHHEQWSGNGYPNGIAGEDIPLQARIVSICDVFDALTSERPHKNTWSADRAMQEIESQSGELFDPRLVRAFKKCQPQLEIIADQYSDEGEFYFLNFG